MKTMIVVPLSRYWVFALYEAVSVQRTAIQVLWLPIFYTEENWDSERLGNIPETSQLIHPKVLHNFSALNNGINQLTAWPHQSSSTVHLFSVLVGIIDTEVQQWMTPCLHPMCWWHWHVKLNYGTWQKRK
jgi:hypothetical protein